MTTSDFEALFRTTNIKRDNFLSRIFGIFSEEVVRHWCANPASPFVDLGRPTLFDPEGRYHTLDFTLRETSTGRTYASEMKCELAYEGYRYLRLENVRQLEHHSGAAFRKFLALARRDPGIQVRIGGRVIEVDGTALIWGAVAADGARAVQGSTGIDHVLGLEQMIQDLTRWRDSLWSERVLELRQWTGELFDHLSPPGKPPISGDLPSDR